MRDADKDTRQNKRKHSRIAWKQNTILGTIFALIGIAGLLYGREKGFALGGLTWVAAFTLIGLYSFLVLRREDY